MATETNQTSQPQNQETEQPDQQASEQAQPDQQANQSSSQGNRRADRRQKAPARRDAVAGGEFNPRAAARVGLLRMARQWRDTGSTHQALQAYEQILLRYPGTGVAAAATEELVEMARMMEDQGQFHSALEVFKKLEQYGVAR